MPPAKKAKLTGGKTGGNSLQGLTFAITGPLSQTRKHFETLISDNGGTLAGSVTKTVRPRHLFFPFTSPISLKTAPRGLLGDEERNGISLVPSCFAMCPPLRSTTSATSPDCIHFRYTCPNRILSPRFQAIWSCSKAGKCHSYPHRLGAITCCLPSALQTPLTDPNFCFR